jgi:hypothetical protein
MKSEEEMMKKVLGLLCVACFATVLTGCGGTKEATSSVEDADAAALAEYKAALEAEEKAMSSAPPTK